MLSNTFLLFVILMVFVVIFLIYNIIKILSEKVFISVINKKKKTSVLIGTLDHSDNTDSGDENGNTPAVVHLEGAGRNTPFIGHVTLGKDKNGDARAIVSVLDSDLEEESEHPFYRTHGCIDEQGIIYEKQGNHLTAVGFTARPSRPNIPTIKGERHWYSFWKCRLNVYRGHPILIPEKKDQQNKQKNGPVQPQQPNPQAQSTDDKKTGNPYNIQGGPAELKGLCLCEGFRIGGSKDKITSVARACGFAFFYDRIKHNDEFTEYYTNSNKYWKDTALIAAIVYSVIYLTLFVINTQVMNVPLFGRDIQGMLVLSAFYFVIWAIVHQIKITRAELSSSIKPQLDMLNKNVGIRLTDWMITIISGLLIICCLIFYYLESYIASDPTLAAAMMFFTNFGHYDFDFLPLAVAIFIGLIVNRMQRTVPLPWQVYKSLADDNENEENYKAKNPKGKIDISYNWDLDSFSGTTLHGQVTLHFDKEEYIDQLRYANPFYPQIIDHLSDKIVRDMFSYMLSTPKTLDRLKYLAYYINDSSARAHIKEIDKLQFALDFVQEPNIVYREDADCKSLDFSLHYMRFPDETLFDKEGDYDCKAMLAAMLFYELDYNVLFLASEEYKTAAIAIECTNLDEIMQDFKDEALNDITIEINSHRYIYCEVASDNFKIGNIDEGKSIKNFDIKVELTHNRDEEQQNDEEEDDFNNLPDNAEDQEITYEWDLDPRFGKQVHGALTLKFSGEHIDATRSENPFIGYEKKGGSLVSMVQIMFRYLKQNPETQDNIQNLARYIRQVATQNNLNKAETMQFILDFVQEPNITYCHDNESDEIGNPKMYIRYPDETLYDKRGDCDCKTMLAVALFSACGYKPLFIASEIYHHAALAIACDDEIKQLLSASDEHLETIQYNDQEYLFCETTGDGFKVGEIDENKSAKKFESIIDFGDSYEI